MTARRYDYLLSALPGLEEEDLEPQVEEEGPLKKLNTGVDPRSHASAKTLLMRLGHVLPGTRRFQDLPHWRYLASNKRFRME